MNRARYLLLAAAGAGSLLAALVTLSALLDWAEYMGQQDDWRPYNR